MRAGLVIRLHGPERRRARVPGWRVGKLVMVPEADDLLGVRR